MLFQREFQSFRRNILRKKGGGGDEGEDKHSHQTCGGFCSEAKGSLRDTLQQLMRSVLCAPDGCQPRNYILEFCQHEAFCPLLQPQVKSRSAKLFSHDTALFSQYLQMIHCKPCFSLCVLLPHLELIWKQQKRTRRNLFASGVRTLQRL